MLAQPSCSFRTVLALAGLGVFTASARAGSIDDAAGRVVVPLVAQDAGLDTRVFVTNHETRHLKVQVRWAGMQYGPAPGLKVCPSVTVLAGSVTTLDVAQHCGLPANAGPGMLVLSEVDPGVARISARARIDVLNPVTARTQQTLAIGGLPLPALDTTENVHVVGGLRQNAPGSGAVLATDCFFGMTFDGTGYGGLLGRFTLKDELGHVLGSPAYFSVPPFELAQLRDVFALAGVLPGTHGGVRGEFVLSGGGDAVVGYCVTTHEGPVRGDRTLAFNLAQVAEPQDEARRRQVGADSTPGLGGFRLAPGQAKAVHGIYVRHPDRVACRVSSVGTMVITAVSPDQAQTIGGTSAVTPEFGNSPHGSVAGGVDDLWGLEVSWGPGPQGPQPLPYSISCLSGNGTSLADRLF
jgi:hypothetical protein